MNKNKVSLQEAIDEIPTKFAEDVANFLRDQKIKGERFNDDSCPIASFLGKRIGMTITVYPTTARMSKTSEKIILPDAIVNFISLFDLGSYNDLSNPPLMKETVKNVY